MLFLFSKVKSLLCRLKKIVLSNLSYVIVKSHEKKLKYRHSSKSGLCDVKETLGDWDGEDIKATQLMNIPTQKFI